MSSVDCVPPDRGDHRSHARQSRGASRARRFVALPGTRTHGIGFAEQAVKAGARAILWEPVEGVVAPARADNVALVAIPQLTRWLGAIADWFFDAPSADGACRRRHWHQR